MQEGWMFKPNSRKRHYLAMTQFLGWMWTHESLCGKWRKRYDDYYTMDQNDNHQDNCSVCKRILNGGR
jgi:hypothetical protein